MKKRKDKKKKEEKIALKDWKNHAQRLNDEGKTCFYQDHKYVSRRDFMSAGLIPFAASVALPTVYDVLFGKLAQACEPGGGQSGNPVMFGSVTMRGGSSLVTNAAPRLQDGSFGSTYDLIGLGSNITQISSNVINLFGIPFDQASPAHQQILKMSCFPLF